MSFTVSEHDRPMAWNASASVVALADVTGLALIVFSSGACGCWRAVNLARNSPNVPPAMDLQPNASPAGPLPRRRVRLRRRERAAIGVDPRVAKQLMPLAAYPALERLLEPLIALR